MLSLAKNSKVQSYFQLMHLHDLTSAYISVPCGHCPQCVSLKQSHWIQRTQLHSLNHAIFFATFTYKDSMIPKYEVSINGQKRYLKYSSRQDFQNFIKRLRREDFFGRPFSYMAVSEFGKSTHRPHWHCLFFLDVLDGDNEFTYLNIQEELYFKLYEYWARNTGTNRKPVYSRLSDFHIDRRGRKTFDFHYCTSNDNGFDDVSFYVTKYVLKVDPYVERLHSALKLNYTDTDFNKIWNTVKPHFFTSKRLGYPDTTEKKDIVVSSLHRSEDFPTFFSPFSGHASPMSPYLRRDFLDLKTAERLHVSEYMSSRGYITSEDFICFDEMDPQKRKLVQDDFNRKRELINKRNSQHDI